MNVQLRPSVLIVDDEPGLRLALATNFTRHGWAFAEAGGLQEALACLQQRSFDLVLCDVRMEDGSGFEVMQAVRSRYRGTAFLFLTAFGSVPEAVQAMQGGAVDYLTKPANFDYVLAVAKRVLKAASTAASTREVSATTGSMIGRSRELALALTRAKAAAESDADVLIEAETGTGKELLGRYVHDHSSRRGKPFIAVNCAALPEALLESELFGHGRGAFTGAVAAKAGKFELANGGTLLLDEIGDMPLSLQPKLLRVLQERVVERLGESRPIQTDIRVIASTNLELRERVGQGMFRSDLFFRLNVLPLTLPALRERTGDLPVLAQHFAQVHLATRMQGEVHLHSSFLERLGTYHWPGNVRELAHFMQRVVTLSTTSELTADDFDREHRPLQSSSVVPITRERPNRSLSMDDVERSHLEHTLELVGGNRTRAAEMLGISVRTMRNKIRQYELPPRRYA